MRDFELPPPGESSYWQTSGQACCSPQTGDSFSSRGFMQLFLAGSFYHKCLTVSFTSGLLSTPVPPVCLMFRSVLPLPPTHTSQCAVFIAQPRLCFHSYCYLSGYFNNLKLSISHLTESLKPFPFSLLSPSVDWWRHMNVRLVLVAICVNCTSL